MKKNMLFLAIIMLLTGMSSCGELPTGTYTKSCRDCQFDDTSKTLTCLCRRASGDWGRSNLSMLALCKGTISNENGILYCNQGSFKDTCGDCSYDDTTDTLSCSCRSAAGRNQKTSLPNASHCKYSISNKDGALKCDQ
jgi:hypothetical protein